MAEMGTGALEIKAAIAGLLYGFEQLTKSSMDFGSSLNQFRNLTGVSTDFVQKWGYAAKMTGASINDIEGALHKIQSLASQYQMGGPPPATLAQVFQLSGKWLSAAEIARNPGKLLEIVRGLIASGKLPKGIANELASGVGVDDALQSAFRDKDFGKYLKTAPLISGQEVTALNDFRKAMTQVGYDWDTMWTHLTAEHGKDFATGIAEAAHGIIHLIQALNDLNKAIPILTAIGSIVTGWGKIFEQSASFLDVIMNKGNSNKNFWGGVDALMDNFMGPSGQQGTTNNQNQNHITLNYSAQPGQNHKDAMDYFLDNLTQFRDNNASVGKQ